MKKWCSVAARKWEKELHQQVRPQKPHQQHPTLEQASKRSVYPIIPHTFMFIITITIKSRHLLMTPAYTHEYYALIFNNKKSLPTLITCLFPQKFAKTFLHVHLIYYCYH